MAMPLVSSSNSVGAAGPAQARKAPRQAEAAPPAGSAPVSAPGDHQLQQAVRDVERAVAPLAQNLHFSVDKESGKTVIRVVDRETQQLIRQIPSEEMMAVSRALGRLAGLLLKEKA